MEMCRLKRYSTLTVTLQVQEAELLQLMTYERLNENSVAPTSAGTLLQSLRITTSTNRQRLEHSSTTRAQIVFITACLTACPHTDEAHCHHREILTGPSPGSYRSKRH